MISFHRPLFRLVGFWLAVSTIGAPALAEEHQNQPDLAIWTVRSEQNTVYLLGSVHVGKTCELNSPKIAAALADAEHAVFEVNLEQLTPAKQLAIASRMAQQGRLQPGEPTLKDRFSAAQYQQLTVSFQEIVGDLPLQLDTLNATYRPWFIFLQMMGFSMLKQGIQPNCGIDRLVADQAKATGKKISGLETIEYQADLLADALGATSGPELEGLFAGFLDADSTTQDISALIGTVTSGNTEELNKLLTESCKGMAILCARILTERNRQWLPQIESFLGQSQDYLVVVGAGHLVGQDNLIQLLEASNYTVERF